MSPIIIFLAEEMQVKLLSLAYTYLKNRCFNLCVDHLFFFLRQDAAVAWSANPPASASLALITELYLQALLCGFCSSYRQRLSPSQVGGSWPVLLSLQFSSSVFPSVSFC